MSSVKLNADQIAHLLRLVEADKIFEDDDFAKAHDKKCDELIKALTKEL